MNNKKYDIFISYRREDGKEKARSLKSELELQDFHAFLDFDELKDGKFDQRIMDAIDEAPVFLFLLTPHALDRCVDDEDWVRKEIEYAVQKQRHIIPINPDKLFVDFAPVVPAHIKSALGQHQFSDILFDQLFKESVSKMIQERIRPHLESLTRKSSPDAVGAIIHIETDIDCRILKFSKEIGLVRAGEDTVIRLRKGKHKLEFISLEHSDDRYAKIFPVEDTEMEDFLQVELIPIREKRLEQETAERKAQEECIRRLNIPDEDIECFEDAGKYGFQVKSTGEVLVFPKYDDAMGFHEGLASVKLNDKYGFIDKTGLEVIPFEYDDAMGFSEGLTAVELNGEWGYIDKAGREVISFEYDFAAPFSEGLAMIILNGESFYIDKNGNRVD
ncbi:MAG: WG repeat-containing protein [Coprobacter sp.]|nr:WG repeat-containing protein [Coprobacter sp.]